MKTRISYSLPLSNDLPTRNLDMLRNLLIVISMPFVAQGPPLMACATRDMGNTSDRAHG